MILSTLEQILLISMIFCLMIGIGCSLKKENLIKIKSSKINILLGLTLQYLSMPLLTLGICRIFGLTPDITIVLLLISCCPGGTTSNMFTYFSKANVELSIILTTITTTLAFLMTPLLLSTFGSSSSVIVPIKQLVIILLSILFPILLGLWIRKKSITWAKKVEKIGARIGTFTILIMIFIWTPKLYNILKIQNLKLFLSIGSISAIGILIGFILSFITKRNKNDSIALAFETGIQNAPLAFAIITLSFPSKVAIELGWIPLVYGALSVGVAITYLIIIKLHSFFSISEENDFSILYPANSRFKPNQHVRNNSIQRNTKYKLQDFNNVEDWFFYTHIDPVQRMIHATGMFIGLLFFSLSLFFLLKSSYLSLLISYGLGVFFYYVSGIISHHFYDAGTGRSPPRFLLPTFIPVIRINISTTRGSYDEKLRLFVIKYPFVKQAYHLIEVPYSQRFSFLRSAVASTTPE